jgi:hypothetical protein
MIGKSITHSPRQQCIATSLLDAIATDLVTKSFGGFTLKTNFDSPFFDFL